MAVSKRLRFEVLRRDNHTCRYCGAKAPDAKLVVDHVTPETLGGRTVPENLVAACDPCNSGKTSTSPDEGLVADVASDALRWSRAVAAASQRMLADLRAREADADLFEQRWNEWTSAGQRFPLPAGWRASVHRFIAAGLPMPVLIACVEKAMATPKVRHEEVFRYTCGIAWRKVTELHEAARIEVGEPQTVTSTATASCTAECHWTCAGRHDNPVARARIELAEVLLGDAMDAYPGLVDEVIQTGLDDSSRDEDERWFPEESEPLVASARILVAYLVGEVSQYESLARSHLRDLSPEDRQWCEDEAAADYHKAEMTKPHSYEHARHLLRYAFTLTERIEAEVS